MQEGGYSHKSVGITRRADCQVFRVQARHRSVQRHHRVVCLYRIRAVCLPSPLLKSALTNHDISNLHRLENKDVSVGLARTSSGLTWDQFWLLLKEIQDALVSAASSSASFKYSRLPAYVPPCDTCESKHFECVRKIAPSTKCQVCSIRKKVCTRQDNVYESEYAHTPSPRNC